MELDNLDNRKITPTAFLDVEGAFDRTSLDAMAVALATHGIEDTISRLIQNMLREILFDENLEV